MLEILKQYIGRTIVNIDSSESWISIEFDDGSKVDIDARSIGEGPWLCVTEY